MNSTNPYDLLTEHFNKHKYERGANVGSAPLDGSRRWASGRRVTVSSECARVICHKTPVLTAYPDGTITLDTGDWRTNCTRDTINAALRLTRVPAYVSARRLFSLNQWCISLFSPPHTIYAFYDNLTLSPNTYQPINPRPFNARRIDTTKSRPFTTKSREFFRTLPLLYAATPPLASSEWLLTNRDYHAHKLYRPEMLREALTSQPELWPTVVGYFAYGRTLSGVRDAILAAAKEDLYHIVPTTTTAI